MKYAKKYVFFRKYLVISKKSSTFAPAFEKELVFLAQLVEQLTLNQWVQGSSPWEDTKKQYVENVVVTEQVTTIFFSNLVAACTTTDITIHPILTRIRYLIDTICNKIVTQIYIPFFDRTNTITQSNQSAHY